MPVDSDEEAIHCMNDWNRSNGIDGLLDTEAVASYAVSRRARFVNRGLCRLRRYLGQGFATVAKGLARFWLTITRPELAAACSSDCLLRRPSSDKRQRQQEERQENRVGECITSTC